MPPGYVMVDARTVRGPDGIDQDVHDAINALVWTKQLCPLMRHEYTPWNAGGGPRWARDVIATILLASNPDSFAGYFRGAPKPNRYWIAPDGLRYWQARMQTCRGDPDDPGVRRVDQGAKPEDRTSWEGPRFAPRGIGIYEKAGGRTRPTAEVLAAGYLPCAECARRKYDIDATVVPIDPDSIVSFIASAQGSSRAERGRDMDRDELAALLRTYPEQQRGPFYRDTGAGIDSDAGAPRAGPRTRDAGVATDTIAKVDVVRRLLELRAQEAPLGSSRYRGPLTQKAIADIAGVHVKVVTKAAIELDRKLAEADETGSD